MKMNKIDPNKTQPEDELDRLLDAVLASYRNLDPRPGLDERILANLRSEQPVARPWWLWGMAMAVAAILVVVALSLRWGRPHPAVADHPAADHPASGRLVSNPPQKNLTPPNTASKIEQASSGDSNAARQPTPRSLLRTRRLRHETEVAKNPRLDQFPSPQPLSPEEIALAQYVRNFPKDAQLIAKAQRQFDLETQKKMTDTGSEGRSLGSIQQDSIQQER